MRNKWENKTQAREESKVDLLVVLLLCYSLTVTALITAVSKSNLNHQMLVCYAIVVAALLFCYVLFHVLSKASDIAKLRIIQNDRIKCFKSVTFLICTVTMLMLFLGTDATFGMNCAMDEIWGPVSKLPEGKIALLIWYISFGIVAGGFICSLKTETQFGKKVFQVNGREIAVDFLIISVSTIACLYVFGYCYRPNIFALNWYSRHHITAVTQSIYNVAFNEPFSVPSSSVYGHYAIFYWPFLKMLGHSSKVIALLLAATGVITEIIWIRCLCSLVKHTGLRVFAIIASLSHLLYWGTYIQGMPLRWLFPFSVLLYLIRAYQKKTALSRNSMIGGFILCALAIVWQTDSGITCTLAYMASLWVIGWEENQFFSLKMRKLYLLTFIGCIGSVFLMLSIIGGYNLLNGGEMNIKTFIYPLFSDDGYIASLTSSGAGKAHWNCILMLLLFSFLLVAGLASTNVLKVKGIFKNCMCACLGIFGLSQCYYFLNRMIAGTGNVVPYAIIGLCLILELRISIKDECRKSSLFYGTVSGISIAGILILSSMFTGTASRISDVFDSSFWDDTSMLSTMQQVKEIVPENTMAIGYGTQELYAELGWNPQYHFRDPSDLGGVSWAKAKEVLKEENAALFSSGFEVLLPDEDWQLVGVMGNENLTLEYYERNQE